MASFKDIFFKFSERFNDNDSYNKLSYNPLLKNCFNVFCGILFIAYLFILISGLKYTISFLSSSGIVIEGLYFIFWNPGILVNNVMDTEFGIGVDLPVGPVGPIKLEEPVKPVGPIKLEEPVKPVGPVKTIGPVKPVGPVKTIGPVKPVGPVKLEEPGKFLGGLGGRFIGLIGGPPFIFCIKLEEDIFIML